MEKPRKKILDCPFCGEQPEKATATTPRGIIYFLECTNDKCPAHTVSVCGDHFEQSSINKWNTRAMSTWLEGEVPSKEELRKIVVKALDIENLKASEEIMKNFPMTVLEICNGADEIVDNVHALLTRKLTGKV